MSISHLPKLDAFKKPNGVSFKLDEIALSKWQPEIRAAAEGDENIISIYDVIGHDLFDEGVTSKRVAGALRRIGNQEVTVNINSPGGDFFEGIAIYNLLREHPSKVTVKVMGLAASAASVIAMAGDDIQISKIGFMMVHNAWVLAIGNRHDLRAAADTIEPFDQAMAQLYADRSGATPEEAASWMDAETWFGGDKAVESGLADSVLSSSQIEKAKDDDGAKTMRAQRKVDAMLAQMGVSVSERKSLIKEIRSGMPGAAANKSDMPGAVTTDTPGAVGIDEADVQKAIDALAGRKEAA